MKKLLFNICILLTLLFSFGCNKKIIIDEKTSLKLCSMAQEGKNRGNYGLLIAEIEKTFTPKRVYITKEGIYIVIKKFMVVEDGFFISLTNKELPGKGYDPQYEKINGCLYRYHISG